MTVAELRTILEALPERFDNLEVCVRGAAQGLHHIRRVQLDSRKWSSGIDIPDDRLGRKVKLHGGALWLHEPDEWQLVGPWPEHLADLNLDRGPTDG